MKPGRELDALVAAKVMGWSWDGRSAWSPCGSRYARTLDERITLPQTVRDDEGWLPFYSTSIAAAWEVIEKLQLLEDQFLGKTPKSGEWMVGSPDSDGAWDYQKGESAPHAICLAALKTVGVDP